MTKANNPLTVALICDHFFKLEKQLQETQKQLLNDLNLPSSPESKIGISCDDSVTFDKVPALSVAPGWYYLKGLEQNVEVKNFNEGDIVIFQFEGRGEWMSERLFLALARPVVAPE